VEINNVHKGVTEMRVKGARKRMARGAEGDAGFTLIELLVVIIIIAILAAIAIPTFLSQREKAQDASAYSLVRNALTVMQTAFVDTADYTKIDSEMLEALETNLSWVAEPGDMVTTSPPSITPEVVADAERGEVAYFLESRSTVDLATRSASGNWYGIQVDTVNISETGYVKVKMIDGSAELGW
jgi:prepilin-type N-terminal cleavage/methylation domain-containing protein